MRGAGRPAWDLRHVRVRVVGALASAISAIASKLLLYDLR